MKHRMILGDTQELGTSADTLCLLHFDGNVVDATGKSTWTGTGNYSFSSDGKFGKSLAFNNSDIRSTDQSLRPTGNEWTIEWWDKKIGSISGWLLAIESTINITWGVQVYWDGSFFNFQASNGLNLNIGSPTSAWRHVAIVCHNNVVSSYVNGVLLASSTYNNTLPTFARSKIGYYGQQVSGFLIDEFRISNVARWTSNFTPPTKPY